MKLCSLPVNKSSCYRCHWRSFTHKTNPLLHQHCSITISPIEPLTRVQTHSEFSQTMKSFDSITKPEPSPLLNRERARKAPDLYYSFNKHDNASSRHKFPLLQNEMAMYEHGVSDDNLDFIAETEDQVRASKAYLHALPGGERVETLKRINPMTGEEQVVKRITAPFDEEVVSSRNERFAFRNKSGELHAQMHQLPRFTLDSRAQLNLKKEHQLQDLLASPMNALAKAKEVCLMLHDFYNNKLALQSRCGEEVMMLLSQVSLQLRLQGKTSSSLQLSLPSSSTSSSSLLSSEQQENEKHPKIDINITCTYKDMSSVPFLQEMRELYKHFKSCFVAPTPLMMEHLMVTLGAVQSRNKKVFQIAERLFLDADKYVFLPTRTTYAAFFNICKVNEHMTEAMARMRDAVLKLHISLDAAMAESLLTGLNELGYVEEAVSLLARCDHIPMTTPLLNASLETLLLSQQPQACFAAFRAVAAQAQLSLNADTYTLLLLACEQSGNWHEVTFVLSDMQQRRVRGNTQTLNLLLKGLMTEKLNDYALQLYNTMHRKHVQVWPALQSGVNMLQDSKKTSHYNKNCKLGNNKDSNDDNIRTTKITGLTYKQQLRRRSGKPAL